MIREDIDDKVAMIRNFNLRLKKGDLQWLEAAVDLQFNRLDGKLRPGQTAD
jgi:hypothetical protein